MHEMEMRLAVGMKCRARVGRAKAQNSPNWWALRETLRVGEERRHFHFRSDIIRQAKKVERLLSSGVILLIVAHREAKELLEA